MRPSLVRGDVVILDRLSYFISSPQIGDIVVFRTPDAPEISYSIKRIIAGPGDEVDFIYNNFYVNGYRLNDPFSYYDVHRMAGWVDFPIIIEDGFYFVLGDYRNGSWDSRFADFGNIPYSNIVGRVWIRIHPLSSFARIR